MFRGWVYRDVPPLAVELTPTSSGRKPGCIQRNGMSLGRAGSQPLGEAPAIASRWRVEGIFNKIHYGVGVFVKLHWGMACRLQQ